MTGSLTLSAAVHAQTLRDVPGTVVYWRDSPMSRFWPAPNRIYTASPSIAVLPDGDYLVAFNLFGGGLKPPAADGTTFIYRSTDRGATWTNLTPQRMSRMKRGSLFVHGNDVYLWGYSGDGSGDDASGSVVIRRASDHGSSWTCPFNPGDPGSAEGDPANGFLLKGRMGGTPFNPVLHDGRLWMAQGGKRVMSVDAGADWLRAENWTRSKTANTDSGPLGIPESYRNAVITEAQIVASPGTGVVLIPKVKGEPRTVLIRATRGGAVADPSPGDWVDLPGGEKKFGAGYDPVSGRFFVVSNPVLPAHAGHDEPPDMIRNAAALLSSMDLRHWTVEKLFLYSPNVGYEGFQYLNFDIDGDDMIVASRTAFDLTGEPGVRFRPPRGHDSNLITVHRIAGFRDAAPDQYLAVIEGEVRRFERTQHAPAPLGPFIRGRTFDGQPLGPVAGLARERRGIVAVLEASGRVLRFDLFGNYRGEGSPEGMSFSGRLDPVPQPPPGDRGWIGTGSGDWDDLRNWHYWNRPDADREIAVFGDAGGVETAVTLNRARVVRGVRFGNPHGCAVEGAGSLLLASADGIAEIESFAGAHRLDVPVRLGGEAVIRVRTGAELRLRGGLDLAGFPTRIAGPGNVRVGATLSMNNGELILEGESRLGFMSGATALLGGRLVWSPADGMEFREGDTFTLLPDLHKAEVRGSFAELDLPALGTGLTWDVAALSESGVVSVVSVAVRAHIPTGTAAFAHSGNIFLPAVHDRQSHPVRPRWRGINERKSP